MSDSDITSIEDHGFADLARQSKGARLAKAKQLRTENGTWLVPSDVKPGVRYVVDLEAETCTCPDFATNAHRCKHLFAAIYASQGSGPVGPVTTIPRPSYPQQWRSYNLAQTHEQERFLPLLRELCDGIVQPPQSMGRPRLLLSDVVFALGVKTYSMLSARRATSLIRDAAARGFMDSAPSYNSALRYLESPEMTDVLTMLIEESAKPLASVESDFAVDSTGIGTTTYRGGTTTGGAGNARRRRG